MTNWDSRYLYCTAQRCTDPIPGQAGLHRQRWVPIDPPLPPPAPTAEQFANAIRHDNLLH